MFANLFFLILNLLLISSIIDQTTSPLFPQNSGQAFVFFLFSYGLFLLFLYLQSRWLTKKFNYSRERIILFANGELLLFFSFFYFVVGAHRWLIAAFHPFGITMLSLLSITFYFTGLFICYYSIERMKKSSTTPIGNAWLSICFLIPFIIPFLTLAFFNEMSSLSAVDKFWHKLNLSDHPTVEMAIFTLLNLAFIVLTIILLPPLAVFIWQCPKLPDSPLKAELDALCKQAGFKHAGLRIWKIMNNSMTAAIIGVVGKLRYILFTQKLLDKVPSRCITAILAHEIGHSYHNHLFFYPFILMGMVVMASLAPLLIYIPLFQLADLPHDASSLFSFISFVLFALTMAIYFRFVFGYFSRLFERQADLHIFRLNIPACDMVAALDQLAVAAGNIHLEPNWHHYSIQQRIDFINQADHDRSLIQRHSQRVRISLSLYFALLSLAAITFVFTIIT